MAHAGEESIFLTRFADRVTVVARDKALSASQVVVRKLEENPKITIVLGATPTGFAVTDDGRLRALLVERDGAAEEVPAASLAIGRYVEPLASGLRPGPPAQAGVLAV